MYSIIVPSRAGLAALAFVLIISLVSAVPIPFSSTLSSRASNNHNGQVHCDVINKIPQISLVNGPTVSATTTLNVRLLFFFFFSVNLVFPGPYLRGTAERPH